MLGASVSPAAAEVVVGSVLGAVAQPVRATAAASPRTVANRFRPGRAVVRDMSCLSVEGTAGGMEHGTTGRVAAEGSTDRPRGDTRVGDGDGEGPGAPAFRSGWS